MENYGYTMRIPIDYNLSARGLCIARLSGNDRIPSANGFSLMWQCIALLYFTNRLA